MSKRMSKAERRRILLMPVAKLARLARQIPVVEKESIADRLNREALEDARVRGRNRRRDVPAAYADPVPPEDSPSGVTPIKKPADYVRDEKDLIERANDAAKNERG